MCIRDSVIGVTIADLITVLISIRKPAKLASAISPIEAAKYSGETEKMCIRDSSRGDRDCFRRGSIDAGGNFDAFDRRLMWD